MKLIMGDGTEQVASNVVATSDYAVAGAQDIVILARKAHQVEAVARDVPGLFGSGEPAHPAVDAKPRAMPALAA
ncbi:MAG: hypothetical protein ACYC9Z_02610 [Casimicrobiaceae bacterium]